MFQTNPSNLFVYYVFVDLKAFVLGLVQAVDRMMLVLWEVKGEEEVEVEVEKQGRIKIGKWRSISKNMGLIEMPKREGQNGITCWVNLGRFMNGKEEESESN